MADEHVNINISATDNVSGPARKAAKSIDDLGDKSASSAAKVEALEQQLEDTREAATTAAVRINNLERQIKQMGNEAAKSAAKITLLEQRLKSMNGHIHGKKGLAGGLLVGMKLSRMFKLILIPTILDAVGAVATLGSAVTAFASAAIGALGPVTGLLAAYPGYMAAIGQGFAVVKLGAKQLTKEMKTLKRPFKEMGDDIGRALIPGFRKLIATVRSYIPLLRRALTGTARVLSGTFSNISGFLGQAGTKAAIGRVMQNNTNIIRAFGKAVTPIMQTLLNILVAAGPMLTRFTSDFAAFMTRIGQSSKNQRGLTNFFEKTYTITKGLIKVTADLSMAFYNIFKIGAKWGGEMGRSIEDVVAAFRAWTETAKGRSGITKWFETMRPIAEEVGGIFVDLAKGLGSISMDKTLLTTLETIRNDTVPALIRLLQGSSGKFIEPLSRIVGTIANIMIEFKAFPVILNVIAKALDTIATIIQKLPDPLKQMLGYMVTLSSLFKFTGMIGIGKLFAGGAVGGLTKTTGAVGLLTKAFGALKVGAANVAYVLGQMFVSSGQVGAGLGLLGRSAKETGSKMTSAFAASKAGPLILAAIGLAAINAASEISNMRKEVAALNEELARTGSPEAFAASRTKMNDIRNQSAGQYVMSGKPFLDAFNLLKWLGEGATGNNPGPIGDVFSIGKDKQAADDLQRQIDETRLLQQKVAGTIFAPTMDTTSTWDELAALGTGKKPKNSLGSFPVEFTATAKQVDLIQKIGVEAGVDWSKGFDQAYEAVLRFKTVNYDSVPAVRDLYNALDTLGNTASTSADKVDAFGSVLTSLQSIGLGQGKRQARVDVARGYDTLARSMEGATVSFRKGNVVFKATKQNNIALNDSLVQQANAMANVANETFKQTGNANKAAQAYRNEYDILVNKLAKGLDITTKQAGKLAKQYTGFSPKTLKIALNDDAFKKWLAQAPRSFREVRRYLEHPIRIRTTSDIERDTRKWRKSERARANKAWAGRYAAQAKPNKDTTTVNTTRFKTPGLDAAIDAQETLKTNVQWINNNPAIPQVETAQLDNALIVAKNIRDTLQQISDLGLDFNSSGTDTSKKRKKRDGGPVFAGIQYLVGEAGPEAFVSSKGVQMIGVGGQEYRTFPQDGVVVPNHVLADSQDVIASMSNQMAGAVSTVSGAPVQAVVKIGTINAASDVDVVQAVKKGIRDAERNARERR